ncbi:MAG: glycosyltransferase [Verrucomicrobiales bacterium]|nr:glycosyltransferase [Verrucomicrobiales bacterium]
MQWIFWTCLFLMVYTFLGYPLLLAVLSFLSKLLSGQAREPKRQADPVSVSLVLVVHNEEQHVFERIENLLQADYAHVVEVLVICDRCSDNTGPVAAAAGDDIQEGGIDQWVRVVELERGKDGRAAGVNQAVAIAKGEVVVFADMGQRFENDAVSHLAAAFVDKKVAAATGYLQASSEKDEMRTNFYAELDKMICEKESDFGSTVGCERAIYAVRGDAYEAIAEDTLADELAVPMKIALGGYRVLFVPEAVAHTVSSSGSNEGGDVGYNNDKASLMAGEWQLMFANPSWLFPWVNRLAWQLISHRYFRLLSPLFIVLILLSNLALLNDWWFYWLCFFGQLLAYGLAAAGIFKVSFPWKFAEVLTRMAGEFLVHQVIAAKAMVQWLRGRVAFLTNPKSEPRMTKLAK